jgi:hypothetical protein
MERFVMNTIHGNWNDSPGAVTLIDAQHHLWDLSQQKHPNLVGGPRHDFFMGDDSAIRPITCPRITGATPPATMC